MLSQQTLLIYLNERAFTDAGGVVAATMRAMDARLPIVLVHAAGEERGACVLARYFDLAPGVLSSLHSSFFIWWRCLSTPARTIARSGAQLVSCR